jgi:TolB protein
MTQDIQDDDPTFPGRRPDDGTLVGYRSSGHAASVGGPTEPAGAPVRRSGGWVMWSFLFAGLLMACLVGLVGVLYMARTGHLNALLVDRLRIAVPTSAVATAIPVVEPLPTETATPVPTEPTTETAAPTGEGDTMALPEPLEMWIDVAPKATPATIAAVPPTPTPLPPTEAAPQVPPAAPDVPPPPAPDGMKLEVTPHASPVAIVAADDGDESSTTLNGEPAALQMGPFIGPIGFSATTQDGRTLSDRNVFSGAIIEVKATFTYRNMTDGMDWERRWYLDDRAMAGKADVWSKGESGTYVLTLAAGGNPLNGGVWRLEISVDGDLMQSGEFILDAPAPPVPSPTPTAQPTEAPPTRAIVPEPPATPEETPTFTPPPAPKRYTLAFSRWDGGKHNLYIARTDGSGETFLLERASGPSWSPDGRYLVFAGAEGVDRQTRDGAEYHFEGISNGIISLDMANWSTDLTRVTLLQHVRDGSVRWAAWAPRGDMVAYDAARGGPDRRIYFLGTSDNQQYSIEIPGEQADWSPDSNRLTYRSGRDNRQGIWISNRDDSSPVQITADGSDAFPAWSPDGRKIAFHRDSGGNVDIYVMNVDGSNVRRLTNTPGPDTLPTWTPDGTRIVFRSVRTGSWAIFIMNADSSDQRQILANADPGPDWSFGRMAVQ